MTSTAVTVVTEEDLAELLPLMRAYCEFYEVDPADADLLAMSRALIADPEREGLQLVARDAAGGAVGFATLCWTWSTLGASRTAVLNDLFVRPGARGQGMGRALITAGLGHARRHGADQLTWLTAPDNATAQALYDGVGAERAEWVEYSLPTFE